MADAAGASEAASWPKCAFWTYSFDLYARPGVKVACISLQERHGLDVNLVLFAFWLASLGIVLDRSGLGVVEQAIAEFRAEVVQPLRAVRRYLRRCQTAPSPAIAAKRLAEVQRLGDQVAALELDGEHLVQLELERLSMDLNGGFPAGAALAARNISAIATFDRTDRADLNALFAQAFDGMSEAALAQAFKDIGLP